jgi:hypothetical protein
VTKTAALRCLVELEMGQATGSYREDVPGAATKTDFITNMGDTSEKNALPCCSGRSNWPSGCLRSEPWRHLGDMDSGIESGIFCGAVC